MDLHQQGDLLAQGGLGSGGQVDGAGEHARQVQAGGTGDGGGLRVAVLQNGAAQTVRQLVKADGDAAGFAIHPQVVGGSDPLALHQLLAADDEPHGPLRRGEVKHLGGVIGVEHAQQGLLILGQVSRADGRGSLGCAAGQKQHKRAEQCRQAFHGHSSWAVKVAVTAKAYSASAKAAGSLKDDKPGRDTWISALQT